MSARTDILRRVRAAVADLPPAAALAPRIDTGARVDGDLVTIFCGRVADYEARVHRTTADRLPAAIDAALSELKVGTVAVPTDLPDAWLSATTVTVNRDDPPLAIGALDAIDAVVTGCAVAIAETGTIGLDAGVAQGRRLLTLVPDIHLCVVRAAQIVGDVAEALRALDPTSPLTLISGPSATSDIELSRVEGVHGPRTLFVFVVE